MKADSESSKCLFKSCQTHPANTLGSWWEDGELFSSLPGKLCGWSKGVINVNSWASSSDFSTFTLHHFRQMSDLFTAIVKLHINEGREWPVQQFLTFNKLRTASAYSGELNKAPSWQLKQTWGWPCKLTSWGGHHPDKLIKTSPSLKDSSGIKADSCLHGSAHRHRWSTLIRADRRVRRGSRKGVFCHGPRLDGGVIDVVVLQMKLLTEISPGWGKLEGRGVKEAADEVVFFLGGGFFAKGGEQRVISC